MGDDSAARELLMLQPAVFHILVVLSDRDRHPASIILEVAVRTSNKFQLNATIYGLIRRMLAEGLIQQLRQAPDSSDDDERRRYYRITASGRRAAAAEAARLASLPEQAHSLGLTEPA